MKPGGWKAPSRLFFPPSGGLDDASQLKLGLFPELAGHQTGMREDFCCQLVSVAGERRAALAVPASFPTSLSSLLHIFLPSNEAQSCISCSASAQVKTALPSSPQRVPPTVHRRSVSEGQRLAEAFFPRCRLRGHMTFIQNL